LGKSDQIWAKSKSCITKHIQSPTAMYEYIARKWRTLYIVT